MTLSMKTEFCVLPLLKLVVKKEETTQLGMSTGCAAV